MSVTVHTANDRRVENQLAKSATGIKGLDEILAGGLPEGRPTLVCGGAGSGKTLMASEFLVRGALEYGEPGVYMAFEETQPELTENLASLGIDLQAMIDQGLIVVDYVHIDRNEIEETGEYDLEGLFVRLGYAIDSIGAKRVVLDTIEAIFGEFSNDTILRSELRRLFRWLKDKGVTAVITGERGEKTLTRHGLEEYVSDCVILLDQRVREGIATRILRVIKYRGSSHGYDEYPFLIDQHGISVLPITSVNLDYPVSDQFISTGIPRLDTMLEGKGYYRGSTILVSGSAGTGKTSLAASLVDAACRRGERALYFAYEESSGQVIRNMQSIGLGDLHQWVKNDLLHIHAVRPSLYGAELHLLLNLQLVAEFQPSVVVMDPLNNFIQVASFNESRSILVRMIDSYKSHGITALFTSLTHGGEDEESSDAGVSSLVDTWIVLRTVESNSERNRELIIVKSRGMAHSNQAREFQLSDKGIELLDVYLGPKGALTGTARVNQEAAERVEEQRRFQEVEAKKRELERKHKLLQNQIESLQVQYQYESEELEQLLAQEELRKQSVLEDRQEMIKKRMADLDDREEEYG